MTEKPDKMGRKENSQPEGSTGLLAMAVCKAEEEESDLKVIHVV